MSVCAENIRRLVAGYILSLEADVTLEAEENFEKAYQTVFPDALPMYDKRIEMEKKLFRESEGIKAWWLQLSEEDRVKFCGPTREELSAAIKAGWQRRHEERLAIQASPGYKKLERFLTLEKWIVYLFLWSVPFSFYLIEGWGPLFSITPLFTYFVSECWRLHCESHAEHVLHGVKEIKLEKLNKMNFFEFIIGV